MGGEGLHDLYEAFMACSETEIAKKIISFINDMVGCITGDCGSFVIDVAEEIFILFKNRYEIYGDILAAQNSIKNLKAYEQGGMAIGRIVAACISLPTDIDRGFSYHMYPGVELSQSDARKYIHIKELLERNAALLRQRKALQQRKYGYNAINMDRDVDRM